MKTPYVVMAKSGLNLQQKVQIMANELTRRLYNIHKEKNNQNEYNRVVNQLTQELKNSDYKYSTARQIVISGIRGLRTRMLLRTKRKQEMYRPAHKTVATREKKKLLDRENWYKNKQEQDQEKHNTTNNKNNKKREQTTNNKKEEQELPVMAVMFVPCTPGGALAKLLRENEEKMGKFAKNKIKIIERAGIKLQDVLTRSNPWKGQDCQRTNCLLCLTKKSTEKYTTQECTKRSLVYETWCRTCEEQEIQKIEEQQDVSEQEIKQQKAQIKLHKYIGETSRSTYERGWEHLDAMAQLKSTSHMLKHAVGTHHGQDMSEVKFGMRVLKYTRTSFERQIAESVIIQQEREKHHILNSRTEYNRCSLPRLCTQVGEGEYKKYSTELDNEEKEEEKIEARIRALRKARNKARLHPSKEMGPNKKRRKLDENEYIDVAEVWGQPEKSVQTKNKREQETTKQAKRVRTEPETIPRPPRGSTSPGNPPIGEQDKQGEQLSQENYDGPTDWDTQINNHRTDIKNREQELEEQTKMKNEREQMWDLHKLCKEYLEENNKDWNKMKVQREQERNRILRLEKAGILSKQAKMRELEKKVQIGLEKIPQNEKEKILLEEKRTKRLELKIAKENLWKLRNKEKKIVRNDTLKKIQELGRKAGKIAEILEQERTRLKAEKENKEKMEKEKLNREQQRKEKIAKAENLQRRWAMYRWLTEYITENSEKWEEQWMIREQEKHEEMERWEKLTRMEKIAKLKLKWAKERDEKPEKEPENKIVIETNEKNWRVWRTPEPSKEVQDTPEKPKKWEKLDQEQLEPTTKITKLRSPKILHNQENSSPPPQKSQTSSPSPKSP